MKRFDARSGLVRGSLVLLGVFLMGAGDPAVVKSRQAEKKYRKGDYDAALRLYEEARAAKPGTSALDYNVGVVKYRKGETPDAQREFSSALSGGKDKLRAQSYYNLGNCLYQSKDYDGAAKAYRKALEILPDDADAKYNLELALRMKQQTPPQQQQQQQQDKKKQQQDQDQKNQGGQDQKNQNQNQQDQKQEDQKQPSDEKGQENQPKPDEQQQQGDQHEAQGQDDEKKGEDANQAYLDPNAMKPEDAKRLLDALRDEEARALEAKEERQGHEVGVARDW